MQFKVGDIVEGKVTGIKNYGAFVELCEGVSGMVFISEISHTYVNDINEHLKLGDVVKVAVISIADDGKISLSIKRTIEPPERKEGRQGRSGNGEGRRERKPYQPPPKPDGSYTWMPKKAEPASLDEMINRFKQTSDEKFSDLKRRNPESRRSKRGAGVK